MRRRLRGCVFLLCLGWVTSAAAEPLAVAVASNFLAPLKAMQEEIEGRLGVPLRLSAASTGKLYAQIRHGAPYHVFLAANAREPQRLEAEGRIVPGSRFSYAKGRLALWAPGRQEVSLADLKPPFGGRLAMANPRTAPYGEAARQVLQGLGLWTSLQSRLVRGENIGQVFQYTASGNVEMGLVALSQLRLAEKAAGAHQVIEQNLHDPLDQQGVILTPAHAAAAPFVAFLLSAESQARLRRYGYVAGDGRVE